MPVTEENFSNEIPSLQVAWDATSLSAYMQCPRHYQYRIIESWVPKQKSVHLEFGIRYHEALELWDKWQFRAQTGEISKKEAIHEGRRAAALKVINDPWNSEDKNKNRHNLIRSVIWYTKHWEEDNMEYAIKADGTPAIEESFRFDIPLYAPDGTEYMLCGHMDNIRVDPASGMKHTLERKTSKDTLSSRFFDKFKPDTQVYMYSLAGGVILKDKPGALLLDACQTVVNFSKFSRRLITLTQLQVQEYLGNIMDWIRRAEHNAEQQHWPMNTRMCWVCDFRDVCARDQGRREHVLESKFDKRPWNPLENRT